MTDDTKFLGNKMIDQFLFFSKLLVSRIVSHFQVLSDLEELPRQNEIHVMIKAKLK